MITFRNNESYHPLTVCVREQPFLEEHLPCTIFSENVWDHIFKHVCLIRWDWLSSEGEKFMVFSCIWSSWIILNMYKPASYPGISWVFGMRTKVYDKTSQRGGWMGDVKRASLSSTFPWSHVPPKDPTYKKKCLGTRQCIDCNLTSQCNPDHCSCNSLLSQDYYKGYNSSTSLFKFDNFSVKTSKL